MFDLVSIGHATIDFFARLDPEQTSVFWSEEQQDSFLCLDFDDKTPLEDLTWSPGGNAINSSIGCSRLGLSTGVVSLVGEDRWGDLLKGRLEKEGVDIAHFDRDEGSTDLSIILTFEGERTILSYHSPRHYPFPSKFPSTKWVYLTSLGKYFKDFHAGFLNFFQQGHKDFKIAFNPGTYEMIAGLEGNREIIQNTDLLIVNREEGGELVGQKPAEVSKNLLGDLLELGPQKVVVTDGEQGAYATDGENFLHQEAVSAEVVEKTGAGDSFSAGFLSALAHERGLEEALKWGAINGASVVEKVGSTPGLLNLKQMEERLKRLAV